jgi:hypothetical protein
VPIERSRAAPLASPDFVGARVFLAESLARVGQLDAAIGEYQSAIRNPNQRSASIRADPRFVNPCWFQPALTRCTAGRQAMQCARTDRSRRRAVHRANAPIGDRREAAGVAAVNMH